MTRDSGRPSNTSVYRYAEPNIADPLYEIIIDLALKRLYKIKKEDYCLDAVDQIEMKTLSKGMMYYIDFLGVGTNCIIDADFHDAHNCPVVYCYTEIIYQGSENTTSILCIECRDEDWPQKSVEIYNTPVLRANLDH